MDFSLVSQSVRQVVPMVAEIQGAKNGARVLGLLVEMTKRSLLDWTTVRGTNNHIVITATDVSGIFSATLAQRSSDYRSPLSVELSFHVPGLMGKNEGFTLDPGDFSTIEAEVWRTAFARYETLRLGAVKNALMSGVLKRGMKSAN